MMVMPSITCFYDVKNYGVSKRDGKRTNKMNKDVQLQNKGKIHTTKKKKKKMPMKRKKNKTKKC